MYRFGQAEVDAIAKVVASGHFMRSTDGTTEVSKFELEWAEKIGTEYALLINSGTSALISSLVGLGVGPGDEVIVPAYTFMATASAVVAVGAIPVIAEVDETLTMDMKDVEKKISKYTKCVIPVHLNGFPCDMDALMALSQKYGFKVLEDCCQADGGSYKGKRVGSIGHAGAYSFNHYKIIGVGDGGSMVTNDRIVYERALIYHDGGSAFRPYAKECQTPIFIGGQMRVNEISGAFMRVQLQRLEGILADLRRVKKTIMEGLADTKIRFAPSNDIEGDCGTTIPMVFESEAIARKFAADAQCDCWLPIDTGKHVYVNWSPILERNGAHCDAFNPFLMEQNKDLNTSTLKIGSCPKSDDLLSRSVFISTHCDWTDEKIAQVIVGCKRAAEAL